MRSGWRAGPPLLCGAEVHSLTTSRARCCLSVLVVGIWERAEDGHTHVSRTTPSVVLSCPVADCVGTARDWSLIWNFIARLGLPNQAA